jgi:hypothetical protein
MQVHCHRCHLTLPSPQGEGEVWVKGDVLSYEYSLAKHKSTKIV